MRHNKTRITAVLGVSAALSIALIYILHFPIFPMVAFLEYDPGDIPIFICTFLFGSVAGLILTVAASVVQGLTVSAQSGVYGIIMHIIATGSYVVAAGLICRKKNGLKRQIIAAASGTATMTLVMFGANLVITPLFMGVSVSFVMTLMPYIVAFNLIKAAVNSVLAVLVFQSLKKLFGGMFKNEYQ